MKETEWDRLLRIRTGGRDDTNADQYRYPYEPTPYPVLERLAASGYISKRNILLDYGCGKGRAAIFLAWQTRCRCVGLEYDERIFLSLVKNVENAASGSRIQVIRAGAETYAVPPEVDRCYFFNPFSVEILQKVIARILESWYGEPRRILLFFYYPSNEYLEWLMTVDELMFLDEIYCADLFDRNDPRERILVFELS